MAISIDTVYQKVLALANKEQRGYITPQEFNLFANQAQMEILEQYFYDLNQVSRDLGNNTFHSDVDEMLEQKMQIFEATDEGADVAGYTNPALSVTTKILPEYIYRVVKIERQHTFSNGIVRSVNCEILSTKDFNSCIDGGYLVRPSGSRPIVNIQNNIMKCAIGNQFFVVPTRVFYFKKPEKVQWGYFVINDKALHDTSVTKTTNFELHQSEETELVYKILKFAGVSIKRDDIVRAGQGFEMSQIQQEKQ